MPAFFRSVFFFHILLARVSPPHCLPVACPSRAFVLSLSPSLLLPPCLLIIAFQHPPKYAGQDGVPCVLDTATPHSPCHSLPISVSASHPSPRTLDLHHPLCLDTASALSTPSVLYPSLSFLSPLDALAAFAYPSTAGTPTSDERREEERARMGRDIVVRTCRWESETIQKCGSQQRNARVGWWQIENGEIWKREREWKMRRVRGVV